MIKLLDELIEEASVFGSYEEHDFTEYFMLLAIKDAWIKRGLI